MPADQSTWNSKTSLSIAVDADATLTVNGGSDLFSGYGYLGFGDNDTGQVTVTGNGSTWTCSGNILVGMGGTGSLHITSGGAVTDSGTYIGSDPMTPKTATGTVVIDGSGSTLNSNGTTYVGNTNTGSLTLTNGAKVYSADAAIGNEAGVAGTVIIDGNGSTWTGSDAFCAGVYGTGTLKLTHGGQMTVGQDALVVIGLYSGSRGTVTVDGSGSTFTHNYYEYIGYGGNGVLNITNGGKVIDNSGFSIIGYESTSSGKVLVEGTGSTWTLSTMLQVGGSGSGTVTISRGGLVVAKGTLMLGGKGTIYMISSGQLAIKGQAAGSISAFLGLIQGSPVIYGWNTATSSWKNITSLTKGTDYTLAYQTSGSLAGYTVLTVTGLPIAGDANLDGKVDVGDLGILAANYGVTGGATWATADFSGDGQVDVSDLGILAANYGSGTSGVNFEADYAKVFGTSDDATLSEEEISSSSFCSLPGLSLIAGLPAMGFLLVNFKETK